ncbi:hypothetical protein B566_EDAN006250 [Ephemera danica]|nr:hypothetical protein B566_EDAN006250 [Ephemera danica]
MEIETTFNHLQDELNQAKESLKGVDENIKRFLGRDPNEISPGVNKTGLKQRTAGNQLDDPRGRNRAVVPPGRRREFSGHDEEDGPPQNKRRPSEGNVFSRLSGIVRSRRDADSGGEEEEYKSRPSLQSQVIATPGLVVSRQEIVAAQNPDEKSKARNRRMFGALLGTLQKFRQEETKMKDKEDKRAKVELKLEEAARQEKEQVRQERLGLFAERKRKQLEIRRIEMKLLRMKEQEEWEAKQMLLVNFIKTKSKPAIFYLPKIHTPQTLKLLAETKTFVEKTIEAKRQHLQEELEQSENRTKMRLEREKAEERDGVERPRGRDRFRERKGRGWRDNSQLGNERNSRKITKVETANTERHPEDDSDLEAEAGPELDVDGVCPGKEDGEGEVNGGGDEIKETNPVDDAAEQVTEEPMQSENETNNPSMNVDEKEFEPVYD